MKPQLAFHFQAQPRIRAAFDGGELSSDGGLLPLRQFDERHGLTRRLAACIGDRTSGEGATLDRDLAAAAGVSDHRRVRGRQRRREAADGPDLPAGGGPGAGARAGLATDAEPLGESGAVRVRLRADAGFALPELYEFCEAMGVGYAIGIGVNPVLHRQAARLQEAAQLAYEAGGHPQRLYGDFLYQARSWAGPARPGRTCASW